MLMLCVYYFWLHGESVFAYLSWHWTSGFRRHDCHKHPLPLSVDFCGLLPLMTDTYELNLINGHGYFNQSFFHSFSACFSRTGPFSCMWSVRDVLAFPSDCCHLPRGWNLFVPLLNICLSYLKPAWFLTCHFQWVFYFGVSATAASQ